MKLTFGYDGDGPRDITGWVMKGYARPVECCEHCGHVDYVHEIPGSVEEFPVTVINAQEGKIRLDTAGCKAPANIEAVGIDPQGNKWVLVAGRLAR